MVEDRILECAAAEDNGAADAQGAGRTGGFGAADIEDTAAKGRGSGVGAGAGEDFRAAAGFGQTDRAGCILNGAALGVGNIVVADGQRWSAAGQGVYRAGAGQSVDRRVVAV